MRDEMASLAIDRPSARKSLPLTSSTGVVNYKRHNQGDRARRRRKYLGGYWIPKWAREVKQRVGGRYRECLISILKQGQHLHSATKVVHRCSLDKEVL